MPDRRELDPLSLTLGGIENQLKSINQTLSEDRISSARWRTDMRSEMKEQRELNERQRSDLKMALADIAEMKPKVSALEQRAFMTAGAQGLALLLGRFMHLLIAATATILTLIADRWFHK